MADLATLQTWLTQAETARHKLATGSLRETVRTSADREVTYFQATLPQLDAYINSLKSQIAVITGETALQRGAIGFIF